MTEINNINNNKPQNALNQNKFNKVEKHPYKGLITGFAFLAAIWGGISTGGQFIGYSYLQGRIAGHGLGEHELTLSSIESIRLAGYATKAIFYEVMDIIIAFFGLGFLGAVLIITILSISLKIILWKPNKSESKSWLSRSFFKLPRGIKQIIVYPIVTGFLLSMLFITLLAILNIFWTNLTIAHDVGVRAGQEDIANKPCIPIDSLGKSEGFGASCTYFYDVNDMRHVGKIIHSSREFMLFQSSMESLLFDKNRKIIACSVIVDFSVEDQEVDNYCLNTVVNRGK
jgi:hypothetical protein